MIWKLALPTPENLEILACNCTASNCTSLRYCKARLRESLPQHAALLTPALLFVSRQTRKEALPWVKHHPRLHYRLCSVECLSIFLAWCTIACLERIERISIWIREPRPARSPAFAFTHRTRIGRRFAAAIVSNVGAHFDRGGDIDEFTLKGEHSTADGGGIHWEVPVPSSTRSTYALRSGKLLGP
jgi:hypothetical protein